MRLHHWLLVLLFIALGGVVYWFIFADVTRVQVVTPVRGPAVEAVYATGNVEPVRWAAKTAASYSTSSNAWPRKTTKPSSPSPTTPQLSALTQRQIRLVDGAIVDAG